MTTLTTKIEKLFADVNFVETLKNAASVEDMQALFAQNGVEVTPEEMKEFVQSAVDGAAEGELGVEELTDVNGGIFTVLGAMVGASWKLACHAYGGPKEAVYGIATYWMDKFR